MCIHIHKHFFLTEAEYFGKCWVAKLYLVQRNFGHSVYRHENISGSSTSAANFSDKACVLLPSTCIEHTDDILEHWVNNKQ